MARVNNPVLGFVTCQACGGEATLHQMRSDDDFWCEAYMAALGGILAAGGKAWRLNAPVAVEAARLADGALQEAQKRGVLGHGKSK